MRDLPFGPPFPKTGPSPWVRPLIAGLGVVLLLGLWAGLVRSGWAWPVSGPAYPAMHGLLMASGFFGGLIALERAVALGTRWGLGVPLLAGLGGLLSLTAPWSPALDATARLAFAAASLGYTGMTLLLILRHRTVHLWLMGVGAWMWLLGAGMALAQGASPRWAPFWLLFLFLTILAERLERMRFLSASSHRSWILVGFAGVTLLGGLGTVWMPGAWGQRLLGVGLLASALGLLAWDTPWVQIRLTGVQKFSGWALGLGTLWLGIAGLLFLVLTPSWAGPAFDAPFHAFFVGFTFSMVFGHAPLILPAVARVRVTFHPRLYAPLVLLHLALAIRIGADLLLLDAIIRMWANLALTVGILLFFVLLSPRPTRDA